MWRAIKTAAEDVEQNDDVKVVILQGLTDTAFAAGADIHELAALQSSPRSAVEYLDAVQAAEGALAHLSKPTIAMVRGDCVGAGVELAVACDLRFASLGSRFSVPPAKLGLVLSLSSTRRLIELVGPGHARDLLFTGRMIDATEARAIGLVERTYTVEEIEATTESYAKLLCQRSQFSIQAAKKIINRASQGGEAADGIETQADCSGALRGEDFHEGINAFLGKRPPSFGWVGRKLGS
jgi:enoyl-CoA hydratase